jgi:hypothetical protein
VRGYFNDPRIADGSRSFHFGIDVSAPDGTPVYAIEAGTVHIQNERAVAVVGDGSGRTFGYWHIVPAVTHHQYVRRHGLLGRIDAPAAHVHLAERSSGEYRNPLRPGALAPWRDSSTPRIVSIDLFRGGRTLSPAAVAGAINVVVEAYDVPPLAVPPPWNGLPVTPALLRWRVLRGPNVVRPWEASVDFRRTLLPPERFDAVYAPGTEQNHPGQAGRYRFYLARAWNTQALANGAYRIEVEASDLQGNRAVGRLPITVANL